MLWIHTQNKTSFLNVREVIVKGKIVEGVIDRSFLSEWSKVLGTYDSNERAVQIVKEIYNKVEECKNSTITFSMPNK